MGLQILPNPPVASYLPTPVPTSRYQHHNFLPRHGRTATHPNSGHAPPTRCPSHSLPRPSSATHSVLDASAGRRSRTTDHSIPDPLHSAKPLCGPLFPHLYHYRFPALCPAVFDITTNCRMILQFTSIGCDSLSSTRGAWTVMVVARRVCRTRQRPCITPLGASSIRP